MNILATFEEKLPMKVAIASIGLLFASMAFTSCSSPEAEAEKQETTDSIPSADTVVEEMKTSYNLPSALQIASAFKRSGGTFLSNVTNDKASVSRYNTNTYKKAVNFGIYSADLAYCLSNKKYQESKEYLKACKDMGSYLGLDKAFESDRMAERFESNISNEDSLIRIVTHLQLKTDLMFEENRQEEVKVLALVGAWTESLYIAAETYNKDKSKKVGAALLDQLLFSNTMLKAIQATENSEPEVKSLALSIETLQKQVMAIPSLASAIEQDENADFSTLTISETELDPLLGSIRSLRNDMVK